MKRIKWLLNHTLWGTLIGCGLVGALGWIILGILYGKKYGI